VGAGFNEMDADHNRCVITLAGEPDAVAEAAILGTGKAMELIDMNEHKGAHPRVGATDVVPFIPVDGITLEDCVALARTWGKRSGSVTGFRFSFMRRQRRGRTA